MKNLAVLLAAGFLFSLLLESTCIAQAPSPPAAQDASGKDLTDKDLQALKKTFGENEVRVFLLHQAAAYQGRIIGVVYVFGRRHLQLVDQEGRRYLLNTDLITAMVQK